MPKSSPPFALPLRNVRQSRRELWPTHVTRFRRDGALYTWSGRLPELCGFLWLGLLAAAIWMHTHVTTQAPIYDSFTYYQKAFNFWEAIHAGKWFNPLNVESTFRPPGTILMSYPFGFNPDPRGFYFRSVYFPVALLFSSVLIAAYRLEDDFWARLRTILTAIFFTTLTLPYHFEFGAVADYGGVYWGLVDSFLTGLAAVAAACAWRGTTTPARAWIWAVAAGFVSALSILVKPSGVLVAAVVGVAWVTFAPGALVECREPGPARRRLALRLFVGAALIALIDLTVVVAAIKSRYLSHENLAYGQGAIAIMKAELSLPLSVLWKVLIAGLGGAFVLWAALAFTICVSPRSVKSSSPMTKRGIVACLASVAALIFGVWFWFLGSGGANQIRYFVPFFCMAMIWLVPVAMEVWNRTHPLLRLSMSSVMVAAALNLILVLLVPRPSLAWQQLVGVSVTAADFPSQTLETFKRLVAKNPARPAHLYILSFDDNDAILDSLVDQRWLLDHGSQSLLLQRPIDWQRSSTIRIAEIGAADMLLINPLQARPAAAGEKVDNLSEEQGVLTAWVDRLDAPDGVSIFFSAPSAKILTVTDRVKFRESLRRLVARYDWDSTFTEANNLFQP
jgi:hypothetical protein